MTNEFAPQPEMDPETSDLWDGEMNRFFDKGGFQKLLADVPDGPVALDLNTYLPTFNDLSKMDLKVEYIIPGLIPKQSIILLHGRGGGLKTWLALELGARISEGGLFVELPTERVPTYYIDYENSLPMLIDRTKILGPSEMKLWHISNTIPPPRLDSEDWILFKSLLPGLIIYDTLRSCQLLDENSSKDMALIMGRLKELREIGHTVLLLHHTQKADTRTYKGSTAILDLCDHVLGLDRVKEIGSDMIVDDDEADLPLRLGTREKTRFEPFSIYLKFDPTKGFSLARNPDDEALMDMWNLLKEENIHPNQNEFFKLAKQEFEMNRKRFLRLLKKGEGNFWVKERRPENKNQSVYSPVVPTNENRGQPVFIEGQLAEEKLPELQSIENIELSPSHDEKKHMGTTAHKSQLSPCFPPLGGTGVMGTTEISDSEGTTDLMEEQDEGE